MGQLAIKSCWLLPFFGSQVLIFPCVSITGGDGEVEGGGGTSAHTGARQPPSHVSLGGQAGCDPSQQHILLGSAGMRDA